MSLKLNSKISRYLRSFSMFSLFIHLNVKRALYVLSCTFRHKLNEGILAAHDSTVNEFLTPVLDDRLVLLFETRDYYVSATCSSIMARLLCSNLPSTPSKMRLLRCRMAEYLVLKRLSQWLQLEWRCASKFFYVTKYQIQISAGTVSELAYYK